MKTLAVLVTTNDRKYIFSQQLNDLRLSSFVLQPDVTVPVPVVLLPHHPFAITFIVNTHTQFAGFSVGYIEMPAEDNSWQGI